MKIENRSSASSSDNHYLLSTSVTSESSDEEMPEFYQIFRDFFALVPKNRSFEVACKVYLRENEKPESFPSPQTHNLVKNGPRSKYVASKSDLGKCSKDRPVCIAKYGHDLEFGNLLPDSKKNVDYSLLRKVSASETSVHQQNPNKPQPPTLKKSKILPLGQHDYIRSPYLDSPEESGNGTYAKDQEVHVKSNRDDESYTLEEMKMLSQIGEPTARKARSTMTLLEANKRLATKLPDNVKINSTSSSVSTQYENLYMSPLAGQTGSSASGQTSNPSVTTSSNWTSSGKSDTTNTDSTITPIKSSTSSNSINSTVPKAKRPTPLSTSSDSSGLSAIQLKSRPTTVSSATTLPSITTTSSTSHLFDQQLEGWSYIASRPSKDADSTDVYIKISDIF